MKTRPWPLVLLALLQCLTPLLNILFNAAVLHVSPVRITGWMLERGPLDVFESLALMPIAGLAIYQMKRWSYPVFLLAICWSIARNFRHFGYASGVVPAPALLAVYIGEILLVTYLMLPAVRATYFDPTIRWWESKPRYELKIAARIRRVGSEVSGTLMNISEGGAFLNSETHFKVGESIDLGFDVLSIFHQVPGRILHERELKPGLYCYGVQFDHSPDTSRQFASLVRALQELGFQDRDGRRPWQESLGEWAGTLVRTGKGIVPEANRRTKRG